METLIFTGNDVEIDYNDDENYCNICYDEQTEDTSDTYLTCHRFHKTCLRDAFKSVQDTKSYACPFCRKAVTLSIASKIIKMENKRVNNLLKTLKIPKSESGNNDRVKCHHTLEKGKNKGRYCKNSKSQGNYCHLHTSKH
jgi:hypothetical protein